MPVALYRRHRQNCKRGHEHNTRSSEYDERKKGWKRCECPIFVSGTLQGTFKRENTGQWEWEAAKPVAISCEGAGSPEPTQTAAQSSNSVPNRITIEKAVKAFMAEFAETAAPNTQKKYRLLLNKFQTFADSRGYVMIDQWTPIDVRDLRTTWNVAPQTAAECKGYAKLSQLLRIGYSPGLASWEKEKSSEERKAAQLFYGGGEGKSDCSGKTHHTYGV